MQCPSCRAVYSNGLDFCPRCKTPASKPIDGAEPEPIGGTNEAGNTTSEAAAAATTKINASPPSTGSTTSTLLEFPGTSRASRPQWRKDLSARVREIQERRAREAEDVLQRRIEQPVAISSDSASSQLGLVPTPHAPVVNPIVAAALKRLERARQPAPRSRSRGSISGGAAAAVARVTEEQYEAEPKHIRRPAPSSKPTKREISHEASTSESTRPHQLAVVAPTQATKPIPTPTIAPEPQRLRTEVARPQPAHLADLKSTESTPVEALYDDRAPIVSRIAGSLLDLLVVMFASSPFAAIIELTNGNWSDWRVIASMCGIVLVVMFMYLTASTALAGRTWGMSLVSLRAVDADTGLPPTTKQSVGRALLYILSLITLGLGLIYALVDAEARTLHDYLSGTAVVRE